MVSDGIGYNLPQEVPRAFADAIMLIACDVAPPATQATSLCASRKPRIADGALTRSASAEPAGGFQPVPFPSPSSDTIVQ
jgi:hypothetical protein